MLNITVFGRAVAHLKEVWKCVYYRLYMRAG